MSLGWIVGVIVSCASLYLTASSQSHWLHMLLVGLAAVLLLAAWARDFGTQALTGEHSAVAVVSLRYIAIVFAWGAAALIVLYGTGLDGLPTWREWWRFLLGFSVAAAAAFWMAARLGSGSASGSHAPGHGPAGALPLPWTILAVVAAVVALGLLLHDGRAWKLGGKLLSFQTVAGLRPGWQDWAANQVFFFGAVALAIIAARTHLSLRRASVIET